MTQLIYRIRPLRDPQLCLALSPYHDAPRLGMYPLFRSDRTLWNMNVRSPSTAIHSCCHPDYCIKQRMYAPEMGLFRNRREYRFRINPIDEYYDGSIVANIIAYKDDTRQLVVDERRNILRLGIPSQKNEALWILHRAYDNHIEEESIMI